MFQPEVLQNPSLHGAWRSGYISGFFSLGEQFIGVYCLLRRGVGSIAIWQWILMTILCSLSVAISPGMTYFSFCLWGLNVVWLDCCLINLSKLEDNYFNIYIFYLYFISFNFNFFPIIFISWRPITLQYCSGFCHTLTWISHRFTCAPHPEPPSHLPPHRPHGLYQSTSFACQASCIEVALVIYTVHFTYSNIHIYMLFSQVIPPLPSRTVSESLSFTPAFPLLPCK